jgi:hypothetical protein
MTNANARIGSVDVGLVVIIILRKKIPTKCKIVACEIIVGDPDAKLLCLEEVSNKSYFQ